MENKDNWQVQKLSVTDQPTKDQKVEEVLQLLLWRKDLFGNPVLRQFSAFLRLKKKQTNLTCFL